jgi:hypothetical protein
LSSQDEKADNRKVVARGRKKGNGEILIQRYKVFKKDK